MLILSIILSRTVSTKEKRSRLRQLTIGRREVTSFATGAGRGIRSGDEENAMESGSAEQEDAIALVLILAAFSALLACQAGLCCNKRSQHAGEGSNEQRNGGSWLLSAVE